VRPELADIDLTESRARPKATRPALPIVVVTADGGYAGKQVALMPQRLAHLR
jgi:hypothetical protein